MEAVFKSFSSGSCGNCYFVGTMEDRHITSAVLVDAGVSPRRVKKELFRDSMSENDFSDILITHDHLDHIRSLGSFCKHLRRPVWATGVLHHALAHHTFCGEYITPCRRELADREWNSIAGGHIEARYFQVPHDATQTVGYALRLDGYKVVIMTDIGHMTEEALGFAAEADTVVIESNYDREMLLHGPYTEELKQRILKGWGHLSNEACACAVREFWHPGLRNIFLCHLSENNNTPELALAATRSALEAVGATGTRLVALPRQTASPLFHL